MMFISDVIRQVYPVNEEDFSNDSMNYAVKSLGKYLDFVYNKGGHWNLGKIDPTMAEVAELYDVYKHIVHDHVPIDKITTISQTVHDALDYLGFDLVEKGIGWQLVDTPVVDESKITEAETKTYKLVYEVSGICDIYSRTEETARLDMEDTDFRDLLEVSWEMEDFEYSMDGYGNDRVHVTYNVTGTVDPISVSAENEADAKKQAEEILSQEDFGPLEYLEFKCLSCEVENAVTEDWEIPPEYLDSIKKKLDKYKFPDWAKKVILNGEHLDVVDGKILDVYSLGDMCEVTLDRYGDVCRFRIRKDGTVGER